jgi:hypothetical protein
MRFFLRKNRKRDKIDVSSKFAKTRSSSQTVQSSSSSYDCSKIDSWDSSSDYSLSSSDSFDQVIPMQIWKKYGDLIEKIFDLNSSSDVEKVDIPQELLAEDLDFGEVNSIIEEGDTPPTFKRGLNSSLKNVINFVRDFNQDDVNLIDTLQMNGCLLVEDYVEGCCQGMEFGDDDPEIAYNESDSTYLSCSSNGTDEDRYVYSNVSSGRQEKVVPSGGQEKNLGRTNVTPSDNNNNETVMWRDNARGETNHIDFLEDFIFTQTEGDPTIDFGFALITTATGIESTPSLDSDCGLLSGKKVRKKKNQKKKNRNKQQKSK